MLPRHAELYNNLENLVTTTDCFFKQQFELDGKFYSIYNYRLVSYTDFIRPDALECRGHMFEVNNNGEPIRLAVWCMEKFFNLGESPLSMGLDLHDVYTVETKADGSVISTFFHNDTLYLKSKGSLFSEQATDAMDWLSQPEQAQYKAWLTEITSHEITINLEWTSPKNRIVLGYPTPQLITLNARRLIDGEYVELLNWVPVDLEKYITYPIDVSDPVEFINDIPNMTNVEGYVVRFNSGQRVKVKTDWYRKLHQCKDSVNSPRGLYEAIVMEGADELLSIFSEDEVLVNRITIELDRVKNIYNHMIVMVEDFYRTNSGLDRKEYAVLGQKTLHIYFSLAMNLYINRPVDYQEFMIKNYLNFKAE